MTLLPVSSDPSRYLVGLEQAKRLLAEARDVDEVKSMHDQAEALRVYARQSALGLEAQNYAAEINLRAKRRIGELSVALPTAQGARTDSTSVRPVPKLRLLADAGVSHKQAVECEAIAAIPDTDFEAHIAEKKAQRKEITTAEVKKVAREYRPALPPKPIPLRLPEGVHLEVGDALHGTIAGEVVDLIVTSPPYGLDKPYGGWADDADGWPAFMHDWLTEAYRSTKQGGRLALNVPLDTTKGGFRPTYAQAVQVAIDTGWDYRSTIVWAEGNISHSTGRGSVDSASAPHIIAPVEMIALFSKGEWRRDPKTASDLAHEEWLAWTNGLWTFSGESRPWEGHPAPYPLELARRLVKLLSFPGDTVLDPFVGSGTTALAAWELGRRAIGFDRAPEYIASAQRRLAQAMAKGA